MLEETTAALLVEYDADSANGEPIRLASPALSVQAMPSIKMVVSLYWIKCPSPRFML